MTDKFAMKLYEGCVVDVEGDYTRLNLANPLRQGPLVSLKKDNYSEWSGDRHTNSERLHPHNWLTSCIVNSCSVRVDPDPDGPGICPACVVSLRSTDEHK